MDIDRKQRTDIDTVTNDRLTLAIDESNIEDNPYVHEAIKDMAGNNWVKEGTEYVKYNLVEDDNLTLMYDPITKLSQKSINKVTVSFDYVLSNNINRPILDNISLVADSTYHEIVNYELNNSGHIDIDCEIFGIDEVVLNTIISIQGFGIGLNFNGKYSNATIRISNVKVGFKYSDKLYDESGSVINRLEPYIDFYRDDDGELILQIGGDATGKGMDRGGTIDTYSKAEIDNKLATKVNVEIGKGLSSNDYTLTEKTKLSTIENNANYYIHPSNHNSSIITETSALTNLGTDENATQHEINLAIESKINSGGGSVDWSDIQNKPSDYPPSTHDHDSRYYTESEIDTALSNKADVNSLSTVATTGDYDDLDNKPTIPANVSDLNNDSGFITSSSLPTKTSDLQNDGDGTNAFLTQHQSLSNYIQKSNTNGLLKNDGSVDTTSYSTFSGSYNDLSNKPTIPAKISDLANDSDFIEKSNTSGLVKNDGSIDTTSYLSSLPSHTHDDRYYTETEIDTALNTKQATLVSGANIKTVNNQSLLGSGNIVIQGGGTGVDIATSWGNPTSDSKVPSEKLAKDTLDGKANVSHTHTKSEITDFPSIPSRTSDLNNDSGFITSSSLPTKVSDLQNDTGFITSSALPTKTSDLTNDGDGSNVFVKNNDSRLSNARTPLAHTHLSSDVTDLIDVIYPIGSIYMSVSNTSPSLLFGGEWEQIEDKFLLASGSTYANGSTGGSETVSLTQSQMPRHTHTQNQHLHSALDGTYFVETNATSLGTGSSKRQATTNTNGNFYWYSNQNSAPTIARHSSTAYATPTNKYTGGSGSSESASDGSAHENMPPYLVVNVWKRTA